MPQENPFQDFEESTEDHFCQWIDFHVLGIFEENKDMPCEAENGRAKQQENFGLHKDKDR